tara:strand:- start:1 stop:819 length:819 start_codon:yes stop_codon:yes gene_type:complete
MAGIKDLNKRTAMTSTMDAGLQSLENKIYNQNSNLQNKIAPDNLGLSNQQVQSITEFGKGRGSEGDLLKNIFSEGVSNIKNNLAERYKLQNFKNQYELNKDQDFKEIGRMLIAGQAGYRLDLPDSIVKELMKDGGLKETTKNTLIKKINESSLPFDIQQTGKDKYKLFEYNKDYQDSNLNLTGDVNRGRVGANLNYSIPEMPIANNTNFRMGANVNERGRATGDLGVRYQPNPNTFVDAGVRLDSQGSPETVIKFGKKFAYGGAVTDVDIFS